MPSVNQNERACVQSRSEKTAYAFEAKWSSTRLSAGDKRVRFPSFAQCDELDITEIHVYQACESVAKQSETRASACGICPHRIVVVQQVLNLLGPGQYRLGVHRHSIMENIRGLHPWDRSSILRGDTKHSSKMVGTFSICAYGIVKWLRPAL